MKIYYYIVTEVQNNENGNIFKAASDSFDSYPSDYAIKYEMENLRNKGYGVFSAKVEKRYKLQ
ncbi:hypothetical protein [Siminovitchia fordii]|uniref:Uncharacterized protein n=1 Tax=Siminovitchia fordii TaxID=254759 RepID=A0ABQ4KAE7_9BACI|nr:hypothetical protein [Siminovitchia fordii]GIN22586.1 hypothetical protein J1TS3_37200 [Siminovitchia fordii]